MRVLLDTNIWSYIGRQQRAEELVEFEQSRGIQVTLHPAALLEALASQDPQLRAAVAYSMTRRPRPVLLPEAAKEAAELVDAVRTRRPKWLRQIPRRDRIHALERFWLRRLWRDARDELARLERQLPAVLPSTQQIAGHLETHQRDLQKRARDQGTELVPESAVYQISNDAPDSYMPGWDRADKMAPWRVDMAATFWRSLVTLPAQAALADALGGHVDTTR